MIQKLKQLLYLLGPQDKKRASLLLTMITVVAIFEMIGVVSIMPFMAVLMNTEIIESNNILKSVFRISNIFGVETTHEFLVFLGLAVFILLVLSISLKALTVYLTGWFVNKCNYNFSKRLVEEYLHQPYSWFLNRHSADIGKTVLSEVGTVIKQGLYPMLILIKQSVIAIALLIVLIMVDPKLTIIVGLALGSAYGSIYLIIRGYIKKIGKERLDSNKWLFTSISEAFGAVKEIKIGGLENIYVDRFSVPAKKLAKIQTLFGFINQMPRFALEIIVFGGLLLIVLYLMVEYDSISEAIPVLALYAYTSYRLMPALQGIFTSITQMRYVGPSLEEMYNDFKNLKSYQNQKVDLSELKFNNSIILNDVSYSYPNINNTALQNLNFDVKHQSNLGIIGSTGSGKTTLVDVILGLLEPQSGTIKIDDVEINKKNLRAWQKMIGYVPQQIYLSDDTIAGNIAFGVENNLIDMVAVEKAAKVANIHEFIVNELPNKYQTSVGERGIRLSGGQRQRIGIARALYHKPKILFLDEATSALDNDTEKLVMERLHASDKNMTIIMIAHRLSTVSKCDNILLLEKGRIKAQGKFEDLVKEKQ